MIDIGANLTEKDFRKDVAAVISRAQHVNVKHIIVTGSDLENSAHAIALCARYPEYLSSTVGLHPHNAQQLNDETIPKLKDLAEFPCVVAIGETGLDYYRDFCPREVQIKAFEAQLQLALDLNLPVFIHDRETQGELLEIVKSIPNLQAVIHCFTGSSNLLQDYLDLGLYIGITGWICDERRGKELFDCAHLIPDDRLLVETDAPYLIPRNIPPRPKARRNEPALLWYICAALAQARNQSIEHVVNVTQENAKTLFGINC